MRNRFVRPGLASLALIAAAATAFAQPPSGQREMTEQQRLRAASPGGPVTAGVELPRWPTRPNPLDSARPVTDELLANPPPSDWLSWRRTQDDLGFSPLTGIDKRNVAQLQLAWSLALPAGPNAATPLVHDGVIYVHSFGDNVQAAAGAEYALKTFGPNAYLLWDKGVEYTTLLGAYFKSRFTEAGGTIVLEDSYDDKATDFSAQIAKMKALSPAPDFYYIAAMPYNIGPLVKQMRDAGITGPIVGGDGYDTPDLVSVAGAAADNVLFSTHALMDAAGGTDGIKKFMAAYNTEYGHDPENAFAALGYDTVYLLADAIKRAGSMDSKALNEAIGSTKDFPGITGLITYANGAHVPQKGVTLIEVKTKESPANLADIRGKVTGLGLGEVQIQEFGAPDAVLIRIASQLESAHPWSFDRPAIP